MRQRKCISAANIKQLNIQEIRFMYDLKHYGNGNRWPWATIVKVTLIVLAALWIVERDADIDALTDVVAVQSHIIGNMECAPPIEMVMPIGRES